MSAEAAPTAPAAPLAPVEGSDPPAGASSGEASTSPATPSHVQEEAKKTSYAERRAKAVAIFNGKGGEAQKTLTLVGPGTAPPAEGAPPSDEPVDETPPPAAAKPEPAPAPTAKEEAAHARTLAALRKAEADKIALKAQHEKLESERKSEREAAQAEAAKLKAQLDAITSGDDEGARALAALKLAGVSVEKFMRGVATGKVTPPSPEDTLREQVLSPLEQRLAEAEAKLKQREQADKAREQADKAREQAETEATLKAEQTAARERDLGVVRKVVTADEYPLTAALGAFDVVLDACYSSKSQDVAGKAAEFEAHQVALLERALSQPKVLAALMKSSPKIRETVSGLQAASQSRQPAVSSGGPRVAARDVVSAPTTPVERPKTPEERKKRALLRLNGELP